MCLCMYGSVNCYRVCPDFDKNMKGFGTRFVLFYQLSQMAFFPSLSSGNRVSRNQRDNSIPQEFPVNYASDWAKNRKPWEAHVNCCLSLGLFPDVRLANDIAFLVFHRSFRLGLTFIRG